MPDQVKTSVSTKSPTKEELLVHVRRLTEMCVKHRDAWNRFVTEGGDQAFKVGMVFASTVATDPSVLLGYGTWTAFGSGRTLVGLDAGQTEFDTVEETGGEKTHTLTEAEMPAHTHVQDAHNHTQDSHNHTQDAHNHTYSVSATDDTTAPFNRADAGQSGSPGTATTPVDDTTATNQAATATNQAATATNQSTGGDGAHNNLQPYIVVYFWKRTA